MSEYPWDFENVVLGQHDQPCDCAICDEIHFQRLMRKKRREAVNTETVYGSMSVNEQLNREIDRLTAENERFKVMYKGFENQAVAIMSLTAERDRYREALERIVDDYDFTAPENMLYIARDAIRGGEDKR